MGAVKLSSSAALKYTKDIIIQYLKLFLRNYDNYRHICPKDYSHADIYDKEPNVLRRFPTVIVTSASGQMISSGIDDFAEEVRDSGGDFVGYRYSGMYEFSLGLEIGTRSTLDRELFTDLITLALRFHLRRYISHKGIIIKDMRYGGESEVPYDSDKIYASSVQFTTWSEWYQDIKLLPIAGVTIDSEIYKK
jgi:hypothetical protein